MGTQKPYQYKTQAQTAFSIAAGTAALAVYGAGLACIFNPAALGLVGAYAAAQTINSQYDLVARFFTRPPFKRKYRPYSDLPGMELAEDDSAIVQAVAEISPRMGFKSPPPVYIAGPRQLAQMVLPPGARWLMKLPFIRRRAMHHAFGADEGTMTLVTTREALAEITSPAMLRFIVAHEMAHLKTDRNDFGHMARNFIRTASRGLFWGCVGMVGFAAAGLALPLAGPGIGLVGLPAAATGMMVGVTALSGLVLARFAGDLLTNALTRQQEYRADRNAVYATRDLDAAERVMQMLHPGKGRVAALPDTDPLVMVGHALSTHPEHSRRVLSLRKAFADASAYPPHANGNTQQKLQQKTGQGPALH